MAKKFNEERSSRNDKASPAKQARRGKRSNSKKRGGYKPPRVNNSPAEIPDPNPILGSMNVESPVGPSRSYVFPTDSASMTSFGNYVNAPGQENFIAAFNKWEDMATVESPVRTMLLNPQGLSKRVANAMVIGICPYFGTVSPRTGGPLGNPIMLAGVNLKQYIDTSFGTNTSYDPQDLIVYLMAVSAIFPVIAELKRDLRLTMTFVPNQWPAFMPRGLFAALGIGDADGNYEHGEGLQYTAEHLNGYIDRLNTLILTFNRLPMPPEIGVFGYNDDLFDAIYMDTDDEKTAQLYIFKNDVNWVYDEEGAAGAQLVPTRRPLGTRTIENRLDELQDMIERVSALRTSSTAMLQNLFNAYGSKDTINVPTLDKQNMSPVPFVCDIRFLTMIENMNILSYPHEVYINNIIASAESQTVIGNVGISIPANVPSGQGDWIRAAANIPLQFHKDWAQVDSDDIGWAMRLKPICATWKDTGANGIFLAADEYVGFAFATSVNIVRTTDEGETDTIYYWRSRSSRTWNGVPISDAMRDFKYAPIEVFGHWSNNDPSQWILDGYSGNRDIEVTYRLEDLRNFWLYMTINLWAANVNRNAQGTRTKF